MTTRLILLYLILIDFAAFSAWVIWQEGYFAFVGAAFATPWSAQITLDLVVALVLVCGWMVGDAKARGVVVWPWLVATPFVGSISPLLYLVVREHARGAATHGSSAGRAADVAL